MVCVAAVSVRGFDKCTCRPGRSCCRAPPAPVAWKLDRKAQAPIFGDAPLWSGPLSRTDRRFLSPRRLFRAGSVRVNVPTSMKTSYPPSSRLQAATGSPFDFYDSLVSAELPTALPAIPSSPDPAALAVGIEYARAFLAAVRADHSVLIARVGVAPPSSDWKPDRLIAHLYNRFRRPRQALSVAVPVFFRWAGSGPGCRTRRTLGRPRIGSASVCRVAWRQRRDDSDRKSDS